MAEDKMLDEAIAAIREGDLSRARDLLTRLLKTNQNNPDYWLWMSSVVETNRERIFCLQQALRIDPQNPSAKRGLVLFGATNTDENPPVPGPFVQRQWSVKEPAAVQRSPLAALLTPRRIVLLSAGGVLVILLITLSLLGLGKPKAAPMITYQVANTLRPSATLLPTTTPVVRTPTPTISGPTPLWMFLEATYTPTPIYGATPQHLSEAFQTGMRRYERGDWPGVITFMQQVVEAQPSAADGFYFLGEAYRMQGICDKAIENYDKAIQSNGHYGPAFLGKVRCRLALDPQADVNEDLQQAIQFDPDFAESYLEQARIALSRGEAQVALDGLQAAESKLTNSPLLHLYRAQAELALGSYDIALQDAQKANATDRTLLDGYRVLGEAMQAAGQAVQSLDPLTIYLAHKPEDAFAQVLMGKAQVVRQDWPAAEKAFTLAINLDPRYTEAYVLRGDVYLQQQLNDQALADFDAAVKLSPKSFRSNLGRARALLALQQYRLAYRQLNNTRPLAETDSDLAAIYYWRAQSLEGLGDLDSAHDDWEALLALPPEVLQEGWEKTAVEHLSGVFTPTP